ncbi:MAG: hypothetical protein WCP46_06895 [Alphaproteobacteria bacterium]
MAEQINPKIACAILQSEAGVTDYSANKYILGSFGAGPCVIMTVFNPVSKIAALAHIDTCVHIGNTISLMTYPLVQDHESRLEVYLSTSQINNNPTLEKIKAYINDQKVKFIVKDILQSSSLAINAKDGSVTVDVYPHNLGADNILQQRMAVSTLSGQNLCFENIYGKNENGVQLVFDSRKEVQNTLEDMLDQETGFGQKPYITSNTGNTKTQSSFVFRASNTEVQDSFLYIDGNREVQGLFARKPDLPKLYIASNTGDTEAVRSLLERGYSPNEVGPVYAQTPLHICRTAEVAELLISYGADLKAKNQGGDTPYEFISWGNCHANGEYEALLGVITEAMDVQGIEYTPYQCA